MAKIVDFKDIVDAVMEELKLQEGDTVNQARIKRIINEIYIQEVVPYTRWKWLKGHGAIKFAAAYSDGKASVTPASTTVTLSTAPSVSLGSFEGKFFSTSSLNEIYVIESHTAGSTTVVLSSEYLGSLDSEAIFKIWTDKVSLPVDCRETETVWHNMRSTPMKPLGLQKFREVSLQNPKAEGYPVFYYTDDYHDPSAGTDETESDRYRQLRVHPAICNSPVTINFDYTKEVSELVDDADEPVMPVEDRIVLKYGALATAWRSIGRNPEEAILSYQEFQKKLERMAGKIEDTQDKPRIQPDALYLKARRSPRYRIGSGIGDAGISGGGGTTGTPTYLEDVTINGATLTNNMTVSAGVTIDGVDISGLSDDFEAHLLDNDGAHAASAISVAPTGNLAADDVQDALVEHQLDIDNINTDITAVEADVTQLQADVIAAQADIDDHISDFTAAHAASAVSFSPVGTIAATDAQTAIAEVATDAASSLSAHESDTTNIHGITDTSLLVTTTGTQTLTNKTISTANNTVQSGSATNGQVLTANGSGGTSWVSPGAARTYIPPNIQKFLSGSGTYTKAYAFVISSGSATAGATYTNNSNTYTVLNTVSAQTLVYMSGTADPTSSGTLTKASGSGDSSLTFSENAKPVFLRVRMVGGGGGGGGSATNGGGGSAGSTGGNTTFGTTLLVANGGSGGQATGGAGGTGGTASLGTGPIGLPLQGGYGCSSGGGTGTTNHQNPGGHGGVSPFGGAGYGSTSSGTAASDAVANTGSGGGGGGYSTGSSTLGYAGGGGGSGGFVDAIIHSPSATYSYAVGALGGGGAAGTSGRAGSNGASGIIIVEEHFQ